MKKTKAESACLRRVDGYIATAREIIRKLDALPVEERRRIKRSGHPFLAPLVYIPEDAPPRYIPS